MQCPLTRFLKTRGLDSGNLEQGSPGNPRRCSHMNQAWILEFVILLCSVWVELPVEAAPGKCEQIIPTYAPFDPAQISRHVRTLAADEFEGREPGSTGEALTLHYLRKQFAALGLKPGGDHGEWTQVVPLQRFILQPGAYLRIVSPAETIELQSGIDWAGSSLAGIPQVQIRDAPMVFVGYGVSAPERGWDDYKDVDLHGKVAIFLINDPDFEASVPGKFGGKAMTYYGRWSYKFEEAARRGALAALIVHERDPASYDWATVRSSWGAAQFDIQRRDPRLIHPLFEGWLTREAAVRLFDRADLSFDRLKHQAMETDFRPVVLRGSRLSLSISVGVQRVLSHNVIAQLLGRADPQESVVFSAHWDHLGIGLPDASGDRIYNGAVDNAIGVAGLLELARVFVHEPRPRRSVLFIAFTGEEKNLLGSNYYVQHPVRSLVQTAAVFNMDTFNPHGAACDAQLWGNAQNSLEDLVAEHALRQGRTLSSDSHPEAGHYYRSDHFAFARQGVPAITVSSGRTLYEGGEGRGEALYQDYMQHHYHQPSDEWSPTWDLRGMALDLRLLHDSGREIADSNEWPQWLATSEFKPMRDGSAAQRKAGKDGP